MRIAIFLLTVIFSLGSCKYDSIEEYPVREYTGTTSFTIDGIKYNYNAWGDFGGLHPSDNLLAISFEKKIVGSYNNFFLYWVDNIEKRKDKQRIRSIYLTPSDLRENPVAEMSTSIEGDQTCDQFDVIDQDSTHNWIQITKQENNYQKVWGTFELKLYRERTCNFIHVIDKDTLHLQNGVFYCEFD